MVVVPKAVVCMLLIQIVDRAFNNDLVDPLWWNHCLYDPWRRYECGFPLHLYLI